MKQSRLICFTTYFENKRNNIKNTWKGIKTKIPIENIASTMTRSIEFNNRFTADLRAMSNVFNNWFTFIGKKTSSNFKFSKKYYTEYLSNTNTNTFLLLSTDKNEISVIKSFLDSHK